MRPLTSTTSFRKTWIVTAGVILLACDILAQTKTLPLAARFTGTWKREDGDETITLSVNHDATDGDGVVITNSNGAVGTGILKGDKILYTGAIEGNGGNIRVAGAYMVSPDGTSLVKLRKVLYLERTQDETITYFRVSPPPSMSTPIPSAPPLLARPENEEVATKSAATPAPSSPFVGTWRPADDSAKLTITVTGHNAVLKYSAGPRQAGTIHSNKIECDSESSSGLKSTDVFEMSSNGRTLIRRRTLQSRSGETGNETLTYNRAE